MIVTCTLTSQVRLGAFFAKNPQSGAAHVYTAHSYLVALYLRCPPGMGLHCPDEAAQGQLRQAVAEGHITWTAMPFNVQFELMHSTMIESALRLTADLDAQFGQAQKMTVSQARHHACMRCMHCYGSRPHAEAAPI